VKFARHLAAVLLTVAVVVALGMAWGHASGTSGAGLIDPGRLAKVHGQGRVVFARPIADGPGLRLSNARDLVRTAVIEAAVIAVVVAISALGRQRRRARRVAA
jgi:hypothetical protein